MKNTNQDCLKSGFWATQTHEEESRHGLPLVNRGRKKLIVLSFQQSIFQLTVYLRKVAGCDRQ